MKILLVGNGINLALSDSPEKYNILNIHIDAFLKTIKYKHVGIAIFDKANFSFRRYLGWLGNPGFSEDSKKIFTFYSDVEENLTFDLELLAQLYISSMKFEMSSKKAKDELKKWLNDIREKIRKDLKSNGKDRIAKDYVKKMNDEYDMIITTNYDHNLEDSGVKEVYHAHGDAFDEESPMELITFKKYQNILNHIKDNVLKKDDELHIDIFGISLFNEIHILNVLFNLKMDFNEKFFVRQYIYANSDKEYNELDVSNMYLKYFYDTEWGDNWEGELKGEGEFYWTLERIDQIDNPHASNTFLSNEIISTFLEGRKMGLSQADILEFKFIFKFCKEIKTHPHVDHFLNQLNEEFIPPSIEINSNRILELMNPK